MAPNVSSKHFAQLRLHQTSQPQQQQQTQPRTRVLTLIQNTLPIRANEQFAYDIFAWLKFQPNRLHKYFPFIAQLTWAQLVTLSEQNVDRLARQVGNPEPRLTNGAKKKLVKLVHGLRFRQSMMVKCLKAVQSGESVVLDRILEELKAVLITPLTPNDSRHPPLIELIFQLFEAVAKQMLIQPNLSKQLLSGPFEKVCEQVAGNPVFSRRQRELAWELMMPYKGMAPRSTISDLPLKDEVKKVPEPPLSDMLWVQDKEFLKGLRDIPLSKLFAQVQD